MFAERRSAPVGYHVRSRDSSGQPAQSGMDAQSDDMVQSGSVDRGNQAPEVDTADNEAQCDLNNLQPAIASNQEIGGTTYVDMSFTNEGPACWIGGFPTVVFASNGATVSEAARDGEDPGNVYTVAAGGRIGVKLTAEAVDGVPGCTPVSADHVDIMNTNGSGSTSLQLSLRVCEEMPSVAVSPFEPMG